MGWAIFMIGEICTIYGIWTCLMAKYHNRNIYVAFVVGLIGVFLSVWAGIYFDLE